MKGHDLDRLQSLVEEFYGSETSNTSEMDEVGAFLDLVNAAREKHKKDIDTKILKLRKEADELWKYDKRGAKKLHEEAAELAQQKRLDER